MWQLIALQFVYIDIALIKTLMSLSRGDLLIQSIHIILSVPIMDLRGDKDNWQLFFKLLAITFMTY